MITREVIEDILPSPRYGTVTAVDAVNHRCTLTYTDEPSNPITLPVTAVSPQVGNVVRVSGKRGARFIDEVITGGIQVNMGGSGPNGLVIPASSDVTSERAGIVLGDWWLGQDSLANGIKDFYIYSPATGFHLYLPAAAGSGLIIPTAVSGGWAFRLWPANNTLNAMQTANMASSDYVILSDGVTTYLSSGAGGATVVRGPSNSSTAQLIVNSTSANFNGPLNVGGILTPNGAIQIGASGEVIKVEHSGDYFAFYTGGTRQAYIQSNSGSGLLISQEQSGQQLRLVNNAGNITLEGGNVIMSDLRVLRAGGNTTNGASGGAGAVLCTDGGANFWHANWDGTAMRLYVDSSLVKTFVIPHPKYKDKYLVHAVTEGPTANVHHIGTGQLKEGFATIKLPDYFEDYAEVDGRVVFVQPVFKKKDLLRIGPGGIAAVANLACTIPEDGEFYVMPASGHMNMEQEFTWMVMAIRKHTAFNVEPDVATTVVRGDGPYTYISSENP